MFTQTCSPSDEGQNDSQSFTVPLPVTILEEDDSKKTEMKPPNLLPTFVMPSVYNKDALTPNNVKKEVPMVPSGSLLGADLFQKSASLAMPPPTLTKVKKTRNLVSPGMSMVKWMKLQETKVRPPTRKKISLAEIAKHNTEEDCWMVIRNFVYDVTEYIPYHPGGIPELMKGAGKDATAMFNEVHRWVNFDSILKSCLQGYLLIDVGESFDETDEDVKIETKSVVPLQTLRPKFPTAKFTQNESALIFQVDTQEVDDELSEDNWSVSILNRERFLLKVILKPPELWMAHVKLLQCLNDDSFAIKFQNSCRRAVITFKKPTIGKWKSLGAPLEDNNRLIDSRQLQIDDFSIGKIISKIQITDDVLFIGVEMNSSSFFGIPVGFHVKLRISETGIARKYTPVISTILPDENNQFSPKDSGRVIYFIIKIYPDGKLTKDIGLLPINSSIEVGAIAGRYDPSFLSNCTTLALFAGGSGITPFIRIVDFLRKRSSSYPIKRIMLIFFNHTKSDIIWLEEWTAFESMWDVFHFHPVISQPDETWTGSTGRVDNISLFESLLRATFSKELASPDVSLDKCDVGKFKAMLCGSSGFNDACIRMLTTQLLLKDVNQEEDVFIF